MLLLNCILFLPLNTINGVKRRPFIDEKWATEDEKWATEDEEWATEDEKWATEDEEWATEDEEWATEEYRVSHWRI